MVVALVIIATRGCNEKKQALSPNLNKENKVAMRTVSLYYESPDLLLAPERRDLPLPENPAGALDLVMRELVKGSANTSGPRLLPADTLCRAAHLLPYPTPCS